MDGSDLVGVWFSLGIDTWHFGSDSLSAILLVVPRIFAKTALSGEWLLRAWRSLASSVGVAVGAAVGISTAVGVEISGRSRETSHRRLTPLETNSVYGSEVLLVHVVILGVVVTVDGPNRVALFAVFMNDF